MSRDIFRGLVCTSALLLGQVSAGEAPPPAQPLPTQPVKVAPLNPQQPSDMRPVLEDFQGADPAKQQAAAKTLLDAGSRGYTSLAPLLKHSHPDVAKRANELRGQIDAQSLKMYRDIEAERQNLQKQPLTVEGLEKLRQSWISLAVYASQNALRQFGIKNANELNVTIEGVKTAGAQIIEFDKELNANKDLKGLARALIQTERANALKTLQRDAEALSAAQDAVASSGKTGRHTPGALKIQAEIYSRQEDVKNLEAICKTLVQDQPRSLEVKFAHKTLLELFSGDQRMDEALASAKAYLAAFPVDKDVEDDVYGLMDTLMDDVQDYTRVASLTDTLIEMLPNSRLRPEVGKLNGGCYEYVFKDYAKALRGYSLLRDQFTDAIDPTDMTAAITRLQAKIAGTFPREAAETDAGPAGALAKFLKAMRTYDQKLIVEAVPKADAEEYVETMKDGGDDRVPGLTFADFIVRRVDIDEKAATAKIQIDYFEAGSVKPTALTQSAVKEGETWKMQWEDPESAADQQLPKIQLTTPGAISPAPPVQPKK